MTKKNSKIVISQRVKLAEAAGRSMDEALAQILCMNGNAIPDEQLPEQIEQVRRLVAGSESFLIERRSMTREQAQQEIYDMPREVKERNLACMLAGLTDKNEAHLGGLPLPGEMTTYLGIDNNMKKIRELSQEDLDAMYIDCVEMWAQYSVAETVAYRENHEILFDGMDVSKTEKYQLAVAAALNLKATGKLDREWADMDEQTLSDAVCASMDINDICADAAKPHLSLSHALLAAVELSLAVFCGFCVVSSFAQGRVFMGILSMWVTGYWASDAISTIANDLAPAGISETKAGQWCLEKMREFFARIQIRLAHHEDAADEQTVAEEQEADLPMFVDATQDVQADLFA